MSATARTTAASARGRPRRYAFLDERSVPSLSARAAGKVLNLNFLSVSRRATFAAHIYNRDTEKGDRYTAVPLSKAVKSSRSSRNPDKTAPEVYLCDHSRPLTNAIRTPCTPALCPPESLNYARGNFCAGRSTKSLS